MRWKSREKAEAASGGLAGVAAGRAVSGGDTDPETAPIQGPWVPGKRLPSAGKGLVSLRPRRSCAVSLRTLEEHLEECACCTEVRTEHCDKFS
ncbi:hypothetical protein PAL_GLEAN10022959 [Pteropus alecto]|uniref:Uncharacterized protein n=1 Tax=Pteropus alecto TaxID=9402 RepID=L5K4F4_PTEAL|nr:hypothetical protein PAL_GLEAN10022959 [Pteropus alecto]